MVALERRAVSVVSRGGHTMYGVATSPASGARHKVILFCQAGLQSKSGVGDYFRWLGDRLALQGFHVVRFDPAGTGDSAGQVAQEMLLNNFFLKIQSGVFTEDTLDWVAWCKRTFPNTEIFLWGQCGGCISALMASAEEPRGIGGLILLATPVLFSPTLDIVREYDAMIAGKGYLRKLLQPKSYLRLLSGQSEYQLITGTIQTMLRKGKKKLFNSLETFKKEPIPDHAMFNWYLWDAFHEVMRKKKPILFLNAQLDNETPEFNDEFKSKVLDKRRAFSRLCTVAYLRKADHSLMLEEAREYSLEAILRWMGA